MDQKGTIAAMAEEGSSEARNRPPQPPQHTLSPPTIAAMADEGSSEQEILTWDRRTHALTHILLDTTTAPSLHSQLFVASHVPCFLNWDYPPFLCRRWRRSSGDLFLHRWALRFFHRLGAAGGRHSSWRSKCPFQQPPPLVLSSAVEPAPPRWGREERREYVRKRLRRGRLGIKVPPFVVLAVPNLALLSLLLWDPLWHRRRT